MKIEDLEPGQIVFWQKRPVRVIEITPDQGVVIALPTVRGKQRVLEVEAESLQPDPHPLTARRWRCKVTVPPSPSHPEPGRFALTITAVEHNIARHLAVEELRDQGHDPL